jgi:hypothetical protein
VVTGRAAFAGRSHSTCSRMAHAIVAGVIVRRSTAHNITIYNRFNPRSQRGQWLPFFRAGGNIRDAAIAGDQFDLDRGAPLGRGWKRGSRRKPSVDPVAGTAKIHALADSLCQSVAFHFTPGQHADIVARPTSWVIATSLSACSAG